MQLLLDLLRPYVSNANLVRPISGALGTLSASGAFCVAVTAHVLFVMPAPVLGFVGDLFLTDSKSLIADDPNRAFARLPTLAFAIQCFHISAVFTVPFLLSSLQTRF